MVGRRREEGRGSQRKFKRWKDGKHMSIGIVNATHTFTGGTGKRALVGACKPSEVGRCHGRGLVDDVRPFTFERVASGERSFCETSEIALQIPILKGGRGRGVGWGVTAAAVVIYVPSYTHTVHITLFKS